MRKRRDFLKKAGATTAGAVAATTLNAPYVKAQKTIKWRLQTYAGPALAEHVIKPSIDAFNKVANGDMVIELYFADQLVPTGELFRAMQRGTIDAVQSDDDSIAAPVDVSVFGGYFPLALRYSLDVPALFHQYGLNKIWEEAYGEVENVTWLSAGAWDPCHFNTVQPIRSLDDLKGKRVFTFPTAGKFLSRFGVVPVTLPWEDIEVAVQTGELDGIAWSGITEDYTVGWADVTNYFLTNNISGAWIGSYFANSERWNELPEHLKTLFNEAHLRTQGKKLKLTTIPDKEWKVVEDEAVKFWDEIAKTSPRVAKVVQIFRDYNETMKNAGPPYRYG
jgi:TRAP-type mannitol/chloroaromatic compound transport system substrate-binding protein